MTITQVHQHFAQRDPKILAVLQSMELQSLTPTTNPEKYFERLCREIIGQQLSGKVADVIWGRFKALFLNAEASEITASHILAFSDQTLRDVGMSWAKVRSVKDLAAQTTHEQLHLHLLPELDNEQVIAELIKVKGIGRWTAEMFLLFALGREDVFSFGDLGLKKGLLKLYNLPAETTENTIREISTNWAPLRSYASLALWKVLDTT